MQHESLFGKLIAEHDGLKDELKAADVAADLALLLEHVGKSRADLARELNWTRARVSQVLSGRGNLTIQTIASIAEALGYTFDLMYRRCGDAAPSQPWFRPSDGIKVTVDTMSNLGELKSWLSRKTMTSVVGESFHGAQETQLKSLFMEPSNEDQIFMGLRNAA